MTERIRLRRDGIAPSADTGDGLKSTAADLRLPLVNSTLVMAPERPGRARIDTGLRRPDRAIRSHAARCFGTGAPPAAIILAHGSFDHAGSAIALAPHRDVQVCEHRLEHPGLTGGATDPRADGAMTALLSPLCPRHPVELGARLRAGAGASRPAHDAGGNGCVA